MRRRKLPGFFALVAAWVALAAEPAAAEPLEGLRPRGPLPSALHFSATIYATNAAVALRADRDCRGGQCFERHFSLLPVLGGLAQLSHAGFEFHDDHHGKLCVPLTLGAVGGQLMGLAAHVGGLELTVEGPAGGRFQLAVVPYQDPQTAAGLGVAWIQ